MKRLTRLCALSAVVAVSLLLPSSAGAQENTDVYVPGGQYVPVVVVLDTSDSMDENSLTGESKIDAARSSVIDLVNALGPRTPFGLIAYPGAGSRTVDGCSIGNVEVKIAELDVASASAAVRRLDPNGDTPTGPALRHAADLIGKGNKGTIVLVSDGESNCGGTEVCDVANELVADGVEIQVNTVGLQISEGGADELKCIADATGGQYASAADTADLQSALQQFGGAQLSLTGSVPKELPVVSGTGNAGSTASFTVHNGGRVRADDVRLSLTLSDEAGVPGRVLVPRPVRFLGNIDPGQSRRVDITIRPDDSVRGTFTWVATATANNSAPSALDGRTSTIEPFGTLTGILGDVRHAVVLGDSYASGEGTRDYIPGTDDKDNGNICHRSTSAYGAILFGEKVRNLACSGAVVGDFYSQQQSENYKVTPQLLSLRAEAVGPDSPDAVLLSVGGNDVGFGPKALQCSVLPNCYPTMPDGKPMVFETWAMDGISAIGNDLRRVYRDVDRAVNDDEARSARGGRTAPIVVVPYPRIVPTEAAGLAAGSGCQFGISANELRFFNRFIDALNLEIAAAVGSLASERIPVYYASDVAPAFQPDHTICDLAQSYAVFGSSKGTLENNIAAVADHHELLHPNKLGHAAMARALSAWSASRALIDPRANAPRWDHAVVDRSNPVLDFFKKPWASAAGIYEAGGEATIDADGFAPSSTVVFRIDSVSRTLASARADDNGHVHAALAIPSDIPIGSHHIHALGADTEGNDLDVSTSVRLLPKYSNLALLATFAGLLLVALGGLGRRIHKRRLPSEVDAHDTSLTDVTASIGIMPIAFDNRPHQKVISRPPPPPLSPPPPPNRPPPPPSA
ncbi:VWA domain-containing protein [Rhodococcoides fascians]|uniref:VWA domain-containing protein n=1 Tax=Rhodococcoides fascians TaxID=1828 RepID=UPI00050C1EC6|nr:VWA domain-containing protein [Rhodococcus fascians]